MTNVMYKERCPVCASNGADRSGDNLVVYDDGGKFCFACNHFVLSDSLKSGNSDLGVKERKLVNLEKELEKLLSKKLSKEELEQIGKEVGTDPKGWRGLKAQYLNGLGIRFKYDNQGNPCEMLTTTTTTMNNKTEFVGFKSRKFPKDFSSPKGYVGNLCDLIGYHKFKGSKRTLVIVEGEVDYASAFQMYQMDMQSRGKKYELPAVVSVVNGISSIVKVFKENDTNFKFFKQFERVVIAVDNDDVSNKFVDEFIAAMPRETLYRATLRYKDANKYLEAGAISEWVNDTYWNPTPCSVASITGSSDWLSDAKEELTTQRLLLPDFVQGINNATRGGLPMGRYVIFAGASSIGKTVFVNSMIYDWIKQDTHRIGVVSLELSRGQYYVEMLSRHIGLNIDDIDDNEQRATLLDDLTIVEQGNELFIREDGTSRFHVVDDRDSSIAKIQELCEELVIKHNVEVLILDPISDLTQRLDNQEQVVFNSWIKSFIKKHNVLVVGISHVKKGDKNYDNGDIPDEGDLIGSYSGASSAAAIFFLSRNKMSDDLVERNTTLVTTPKIRWTGRTGVVDRVFFDHKTRKLINYSDYLKGNISSVVDEPKDTEVKIDCDF